MQPAPKTVLLEDEEKTLVQWLMELSHRGFGWTKDDVKDMVKTILDTRGAKTVFRDSWPGKDWMQAFFKRHPKVVERMEQAPAWEIAVVTKESLAEWFQQMKQYLDALDPILLTSPGHAFNADESGFSVCPKAQKKQKQQQDRSQACLLHHKQHTAAGDSVGLLLCCWAVLLIFPHTRDLCFNALEGFEDAVFNKKKQPRMDGLLRRSFSAS